MLQVLPNIIYTRTMKNEAERVIKGLQAQLKMTINEKRRFTLRTKNQYKYTATDNSENL